MEVGQQVRYTGPWEHKIIEQSDGTVTRASPSSPGWVKVRWDRQDPEHGDLFIETWHAADTLEPT